MNNVSEYRENARVCREVARTVQNADQRTHLEIIAKGWEVLAVGRERALRDQNPSDMYVKSGIGGDF
jgi:hypothetical protein